MNFDAAKKVENLTDRQKRYFYELLAHFLTVSMRGVLFTENIPDAERVERAKWLNEIAHRISFKIYQTDKNPEARWPDAEIEQMIAANAAKHPAVEEDVRAALELSYGYVIENESETAAMP